MKHCVHNVNIQVCCKVFWDIEIGFSRCSAGGCHKLNVWFSKPVKVQGFYIFSVISFQFKRKKQTVYTDLTDFSTFPFCVLIIHTVLCILYPHQNMHHDLDCVSYQFLLSPQVSLFPVYKGLHVESKVCVAVGKDSSLLCCLSNGGRR